MKWFSKVSNTKHEGNFIKIWYIPIVGFECVAINIGGWWKNAFYISKDFI